MKEPHVRLRWKISKALKISLDDPIFDRMSSIQILAYAHSIHEDTMEEEERWRDRLEYLARFWDNESVEKIQAARHRAQAAPDDKFSDMLEQTFGRGLGSGVSEKIKTIEELGRDIKKANT